MLFGDLEAARHVALVVPGVGDGTNMCDDWIPGALNLYAAAADTAVVLWKGYDNPLDIFDAATESHRMQRGPDDGRAATWRPSSTGSSWTEGQSLTVVAHSFGSVVTGAALADYGLPVTDVVVAGSPGMTVDELRQLHVEQAHFFSEKAPGDTVAELGIFGAAPTSATFGGTRMRTNAPGHDDGLAHSHYFEAGSEALENMVAVVTGRYSDVAPPRVVGARDRRGPGLLDPAPARHAGARRRPALPRPRVPGHGERDAACATSGRAQTGNLVREALDEGERVVAWSVRRAGGSWTPFSSPDGS